MDHLPPSGLRFAKMQGAGNDFLVIDLRDGEVCPPPAAIRALADRHRGVGFDQLMTIGPADPEVADAELRFYNADGSEAGTCGNATRCAAVRLGGPVGRHLRLRTRAGVLAAELLDEGRVRVDMGAPRLDWAQVPLSRQADTLHVDLAAGLPGPAVACSMGNPHLTCFVDDLDATDVVTLGARLERDAWLPEGGNIGFAQVTGPAALRLRVWERGAGETLACGSGACAAGVAAMRRGLCGGTVRIGMPGGTLDIAWQGDGAGVLMSGPAVLVYEGRLA